MFDTWSKVVVHVAMDNTVVIEEISECSCVATVDCLHSSSLTKSNSFCV